MMHKNSSDAVMTSTDFFIPNPHDPSVCLTISALSAFKNGNIPYGTLYWLNPDGKMRAKKRPQQGGVAAGQTYLGAWVMFVVLRTVQKVLCHWK